MSNHFFYKECEYFIIKFIHNFTAFLNKMEEDRFRGKSPFRDIDIVAGKVFRNPFLNFLKDFRKSHRNKLDAVEITKRAAQLWRIMNEREKSPYINMSKQAPKRRRSTSSKKPAKKQKKYANKNKTGEKGETRKQKKVKLIGKAQNRDGKKKSNKAPNPRRNQESSNCKIKKSTGVKVKKKKKCICGRIVTF